VDRVALIMAGGSGERFWPLSRRTRPKQLLRLLDPDKTLLEMAIDRVEPLVGGENVYIATTPHLVEPVLEAIPGLETIHILAEPCKRNTSGCLIWATAHLLATRGTTDQIVAVLSADHSVGDVAAYRRALAVAMDHAAASEDIVVLGIEPTRAETGYGYIELEAHATELQPTPVVSFREKPTAETARAFVESGRFLWNAGTFFWRTSVFLAGLRQAQPEMYAALQEIAAALKSGDETRATQVFERLPSISIDYALMEKAKYLAVVPTACGWDDAGSWEALHRLLVQGGDGVAISGEALQIDSHNTLLLNTTNRLLCALGVDGLAIIQTEDATLVTPLARSQDVRLVVEEIQSRNREDLL
jgi:mannose-1-phosphate guanylyltransferase